MSSGPARRQRLAVSPCRTTSMGERCLPFLPPAALSRPPAISFTCALKFPTPLAALAMSLESTLTLTFGRRAIALPRPPLRPFFVAARAIPPAAPAIAAPPATSGTFALLAALPTVLPAPLALSPMSPTAFFTASTFECFDDEPLLWDLLDAPLLDRLALLAADFAFAFTFGAFAREALGFDALGFGDFE